MKLTLRLKGKVLKVFNLDQDAIIVGRDAHCDLRIDSLPVAPQHFRIERTELGAQAVALQDKLPLVINRQTVSQQELQHGDVFNFKNYSLEYGADEVSIPFLNSSGNTEQATSAEINKQPNANSPMAILQNLDGDQYGDIVPLTRSMMKLGGDSLGGTITICHRREGYFVSILSGTPSVSIDNIPLNDKGRYLQDGCVLQLGNKRARFYLQQLASAS